MRSAGRSRSRDDVSGDRRSDGAISAARPELVRAGNEEVEAHGPEFFADFGIREAKERRAANACRADELRMMRELEREWSRPSVYFSSPEAE